MSQPGLLVAVAVLAFGIAAPASEAEAAVLEIQFTGLNLTSDNGSLFSDTPDQLATIDFFLDGSLIGSLTSSGGASPAATVDLDVQIPSSGYFADPAGTGDFELAAGSTSLLAFDAFNFEGFFSSIFAGYTVAGNGTVSEQALPFDLVFSDSSVSFMLSSTRVYDMDSDVQFRSQAHGSIIGTGYVIPEPTAGLLLLGGAAMLACRRQRRITA